jgi:hypothetical protein
MVFQNQVSYNNSQSLQITIPNERIATYYEFKLYHVILLIFINSINYYLYSKSLV